MSKRDNLDDIITGRGIPPIDTDDESGGTSVVADNDIIIPGTVVVLRRDSGIEMQKNFRVLNAKEGDAGISKRRYRRRSGLAKRGTKFVVRCVRKEKGTKGCKKTVL